MFFFVSMAAPPWPAASWRPVSGGQASLCSVRHGTPQALVLGKWASNRFMGFMVYPVFLDLIQECSQFDIRRFFMI